MDIRLSSNDATEICTGTTTGTKLSGCLHLNNFPNLKKINSFNNDIEIVYGINENTTLTPIELACNKITSLPQIKNKPGIVTVDIRDNRNIAGEIYSAFPSTMECFCAENITNLSGYMPPINQSLTDISFAPNYILSGSITPIDSTRKLNIEDTFAIRFPNVNSLNSKEYAVNKVTTLSAACALPNNLFDGANTSLLEYNAFNLNAVGQFNKCNGTASSLFTDVPNLSVFKAGTVPLSNNETGTGNYYYCLERGTPLVPFGSSVATANMISFVPLNHPLKTLKIEGFQRSATRNSGGTITVDGGSKFGYCGNIGIYGNSSDGDKFYVSENTTNISFANNRLNGVQTLNILSGVCHTAVCCGVTGGLLDLRGNSMVNCFNVSLYSGSTSTGTNLCTCLGTVVGAPYGKLVHECSWTILYSTNTDCGWTAASTTINAGPNVCTTPID